ncbi:MAG TPA: hypothetical protein VNQ99_07255 [Xanthobacteraceae bacterium]|nr:hypothetical protein [Xanthobacteraceae bacterium]
MTYESPYSDEPALARTDGPVPIPGGPLSYLHWGPIVAGAVVAAAISLVLGAFGASIGLAVASPSPTWRDASVALALLSGIWLLIVALGAFAAGGYLAGRVRSSWSTSQEEIEFRDGTHGLLVWALAVLIGGILAWGAAIATPAAVTANSASRSATAEPAGIAFELDRLFRSAQRPEAVDPDTRAEAGRLLLKGAGRQDLAEDDRTHLVRLVSTRTGLGPADADRRVRDIQTEVRQSAAQSRRSGVLLGFMTAVALAAGAAAAWFAAEAGGRHRDNAVTPPLRFDWRRGRRGDV